MKKILFKNAKIVSHEKIYEGNIIVQNGKIIDIEINDVNLLLEGFEIIDLKGSYVLPGLIDSHVHLREPGLAYKEDIFSGTLAALSGGITTICDMPNTVPPTDTIKKLIEKDQLFKKSTHVDYFFHFLGTEDNLDQIKKLSKSMVVSVKIFMAGHHTAKNIVTNQSTIIKIMEILNSKGIPLTVHAEDHSMINYSNESDIESYTNSRSPLIAVSAIKKIIQSCEITGCKVHILHVSSKKEVELIRKAKDRGLPITFEAIPPHLYFNYLDYYKNGNLIKLSPPLRTENDRKFLLNALVNKTIDTVGSDHAPHTLFEKERLFPDAPPGMPGVQEMFVILFTLLIEMNVCMEDALKLCVYYLGFMPSKIFDIPNKGVISKGYDADIIVFNPYIERQGFDELFTKNKWTPYSKKKIYGEVLKVYLKGINVYEVEKEILK